MKLEEIKELMRAMEENGLTSFAYNEGDVRLELRRGETAAPSRESSPAPMKKQQEASAQDSQAAAEAAGAEKEAQDAANAKRAAVPEGSLVKSPLVGTFYAASAPDKAPFVKAGDSVKKGQVLGLIEAMKLMNEIESEYDGVVAEILIENEAVVEYGQPLFRIV